MSSQDDTFETFIKFANVIQNQVSLKIISLKSDHGGEFVNHRFETFVTSLAFHTIFHVLELLNKMVWLKGKIEF